MFTTVSPAKFSQALAVAQRTDANVAAATTPALEMFIRTDLTTYLHTDGRSGFAVAADGELVGVFSTVRGRGQDILTAAIGAGANRLDCFDGFLPNLYSRFGFVETAREANWTPGGPDVVYMALTA